MYIGKVIGTVVATVKIPHLGGQKLLMVDQLDLEGAETGDYDVAVDVAQAGVGDTVLVIDEGNGARQILGLQPGAVRAVVVGIVDEVDLTGLSFASRRPPGPGPQSPPSSLLPRPGRHRPPASP